MKHITDREIEKYYTHAMDETEERGLLEHVSACEYCAGRWANAFPIQEMLTPPISLRPDLEQQIRQERIPVRRMESYRAWYQYCAKVILAMGFAIMVLFLGDFQTEKQSVRQVEEMGASEQISQQTEQNKDGNVSEQINRQTEKFSAAIKGWSESIGRSLRGEPQE